MNGSVLNSTVKVYPSKNNRTSRSYRSSCFAPQYTNVFDEDVFDKLVRDEKVKGQNQSSLTSFVEPTKQTLVPKRGTLLKDVANTDSLSCDQSNYEKKTKTKKRDKENTKHRSGLFVDFDPYSFNFDSDEYEYSESVYDGSVRTKSFKRQGSTRVRETAKIDLREQKVKSTKLKKAQELREKQQQERAQSRMSKVCSTPEKNIMYNNESRLDISCISKVDMDPFVNHSSESTMFSNITCARNDCVEKSSDIFVSETTKPTFRKKYSFIETFREERKTMSPNTGELSCCDNFDHKSSGSSDARSVQSENSQYLTCLKVDSSSGELSKKLDGVNERRSRSLDTTRVSDLKDTCQSKHGVLRRHSSQALSQETRSNEIIAAEDVDRECKGSRVENEMYDDNHEDERASPRIGSRSKEPSSIDPEYSLSDLVISNWEESESEADDSVDVSESGVDDSVEESESDVDDLANSVDNLNISSAPAVATSYPASNASDNSCASDVCDSLARSNVSRKSDLVTEYSMNWSGLSDENETSSYIDRSKNLTDRIRTKPSMRVSHCCTNERSNLEPCSIDEAVSDRRATKFFTPRSCQSDQSFDETLLDYSTVDMSVDENSEFSLAIENATTTEDEISETEQVFRESLADTKVADEEAVDVNCQINLTIRRRKACLIYSEEEIVEYENTSTDESDVPDNCDLVVAVSNSSSSQCSSQMSLLHESSPLSSDDTILNECTVVEKTTKTDERIVDPPRRFELDNVSAPSYGEVEPLFEEIEEEFEEPKNMRFESTRVSKANITTEGEVFTILYDDTLSNGETTVVENVANALERTNHEHENAGTAAQVTLKLDDLSPIQKVEQSSIVSTVKRRHRVTRPKRHYDTLSEENENRSADQMEETFENPRTDASNIFLRPTIPCTGDSRNPLSESCFDTTARPLSQSRFNNSLLTIHLEKGKKWRRSFIAFKNIMNHRLSVVPKEDCGRLCNQKIENLISMQNDATIIVRELEECSTLKTGSDETVVAGFEEGDTIVAARYERQEKARFSLSINVSTNGALSADRIGRFENAQHDPKKTSYARVSRINDREIEAGDFANVSRWNSTLVERGGGGVTNVAREIVLKYCNQTEPVPFGDRFSDRILKNCTKIGEGVYGEVFMLTRGRKNSVIKIIPIEGDQLVNGERQKTFEEIFSELAITSNLSALNEKGGSYYTECFARLTNRHCVYGRYPQRLITLWKEYDLRKGSENDSPKIFKEDQLYIILELDHGGEDIESFSFNNAQQTLSVFNQVTNALAVAEQAFQFEHRDLHWGNILVTRCTQKKTKFVIRNRENYVNLNGVKVTIIDYTLSRITIKKHTLFNNLAKDPDLFIAEGDFQFEVYRMMRNAVENAWDRYAPVTNVYWLQYLLDKMMKEKQYVRSSSLLHRKFLAELEEMYHKIEHDEYDSAFQIANSECRYA